MTQFKYLGSIEKWIHQNKGEIIGAIEGVLIDTLLISTKRGLALAAETYQNPNSSIYTITFAADEKQAAAIWDKFEKMEAAYIAEYGEEYTQAGRARQ